MKPRRVVVAHGGPGSEMSRDRALRVRNAVGFFACLDEGIREAGDKRQPNGGALPPAEGPFATRLFKSVVNDVVKDAHWRPER
jgi:hypothetical protein